MSEEPNELKLTKPPKEWFVKEKKDVDTTVRR